LFFLNFPLAFSGCPLTGFFFKGFSGLHCCSFAKVHFPVSLPLFLYLAGNEIEYITNNLNLSTPFFEIFSIFFLLFLCASKHTISCGY